VDRVGHDGIERDHVHEVLLAHLGLVFFVLLVDLHQLLVAERVVLCLVVLQSKRNLPVAGAHHALYVLGPAATNRGQHDAVVDRGAVRAVELDAKHVAQRLVVRASHDVSPLQAERVVACGMQGAEVGQLLGLEIELRTGPVQRLPDGLGGERHEGYAGRVNAPCQRLPDDLDQGVCLTTPGRPEDQAAIRNWMHFSSPVSIVECLLRAILRPPASGHRHRA
jgi:hypothetical protein